MTGERDRRLAAQLSCNETLGRRYLHFESGRARSAFTTILDDENGCVATQFRFHCREAESNLAILRQEEVAIEAEVGTDLEWEVDGRIACCSWYLESAQPLDRADWERQHKWLARSLLALIKAVGPRVASPVVPSRERRQRRELLWQAVSGELAKRGSTIQLPDQSLQMVRVQLAKGASLCFQAMLEQNWVWVGLEIELGEPMERFQSVEKGLLAASTNGATRFEKEVVNDCVYVGSYRFANPAAKDYLARASDWLSWVAMTVLEAAKVHRPNE